MESAQEQGIVFSTFVVECREHFKDKYVSGLGKDAIFEKVSIGWFVWFDGSHERLFMGFDPPPFKDGDIVRITFAKEVSECQVSQTTTPQT